MWFFGGVFDFIYSILKCLFGVKYFIYDDFNWIECIVYVLVEIDMCCCFVRNICEWV